MRRAFTYRGGRSDKFWRLDVSEDSLARFHGASGSFGKTRLQQFESDEECSKIAERLIASKLGKGYQELSADETAAAFEAHWYFDDREAGLHPRTSHPRFSAHFTAALYYDVTAHDSPFGSDTGSDALYFLEEQIRNQGRALAFADLPRVLVEERMGGMTFSPPMPEVASPPWVPGRVFPSPSLMLRGQLVPSVWQSYVPAPAPSYSRQLEDCDIVIIATAFGQAKITGRMDPRLKADALLALNRFQRHCCPPLSLDAFETMKADLNAFV